MGRRLKVIVTGGSGFVGTWVVKELLKRGHYVKVIDVQEPKVDVEYVKMDVRNLDGLRKEVRGYDAIIHLAAVVSLDEATKNPLETEEVNVRGTLNVLIAAKEVNAKVVYASSAAVYGDPKKLPVDEDHPTFPKSVYGATKLGGEALVLSFIENFGLETVALRYFNLYGPYMRGGPYAGVIYKFLSNAIEGRPLIIYGDGKQTRDFVYAEDAARATLVALERGKGVYNVGTGKEITILELAELVKKVTGCDCEVKFAPPRPGDIRRSVASIEKIKGIGWEPKVGIEEGLRRSYEWLLKEKNPISN